MFDMTQQLSGSATGPISASSTTSSAIQFADTTYTKVFVGGLAWETQRDTMRRHFEQYGEIIEAVVITDKNTGRSKGYGFVTFREPEAARRACADATPVIDGRRANCNLASLGAHRSRPSFTTHGNRFRIMAPTPASPHTGGGVYMGGPSFPQFQGQYAFQHGFPYQTYGYPSYAPEFGYQPGLYNPYGGPQYPQLYTNPASIASSAMYPYMQYSQPVQGGYPSSQGYSLQLPQVMQYGAAPGVATVTTLPQQYGGLVPLPTSVASSGVTLTYSSATGVGSPGRSPPQIFAVQQQFPQGAAISEQPSGTPVVTNLDGKSTFQSEQGDAAHKASSSQSNAPSSTNSCCMMKTILEFYQALVDHQA